jgi:hypothetical protein
MKHVLICAAAAAVLSLSAVVVASADIPQPNSDGRRPPKRGENVVELVIESGDNPEPQVWLPPDFRSAAGGSAEPGLAPAQTAVAGAALSLAVVFGGLWLVRMRRTLGVRATAGAAAVFCTIAGTAVFALANAGPPRNYRPVDPGTLGKAAPDGAALSGKARYYYGADDGVVRIVLPREKR